MTADELDAWAEDFASFHARFAHLFTRSEPRAQMAKYLRALMVRGARRNSWQLAETIGDKIPDAMQRLLYQACWDADAARDMLEQSVIEECGDAEGIVVVDETGFVKKGSHSVGVQRQYSGTAGKVETCQIGTFLSYTTAKGHVFLDRRVYLPEEWCADRQRRVGAKVPERVVFQTKPEQAIAMLRHAWAMGVPMRWVAGDEVYGQSTALRDEVADNQCWYLLAVRTTTTVWTEPPASPYGRGEPAHAKAPLAQTVGGAISVAIAIDEWPERRWKRLTVAEGRSGVKSKHVGAF